MEVHAPLMLEDVALPDEDGYAPVADDAPAECEPCDAQAGEPAADADVAPIEEESPYATRRRQVYGFTPQSLGRSVAHSALGMWHSLMPGTRSLLAQPRVQFLRLQHVFEDEEAGFRRLLRFLRRTHTLISYSEALRRATAGGAEVDRPFVAISFDGGFKNCVRAAEILQEFNATACFFVCPAIIGEPDLKKLEEFCHRRLELRGPPVQFMDADDLEALKKAGHEIGGQTMTHANLARLTPEQASEEIGKCFEVINRNFGAARHFAWTYGKFADCTHECARMVFDAGFASCASGERGCHGPNRASSDQAICVRRDRITAGAPLCHVKYLLAKASREM
jgi:peptidoglycan/xylan/chitin deacetylase (PgdA/CDA1 family)